MTAPNESKNTLPNVSIEVLPDFLPSCETYVLRADRLHPVMSGNKIWKLAPNMHLALQSGYSCIASFGGAFSNHLLSLAYAAQQAGLQSIGFVRMHRLDESNPTVLDAMRLGMRIVSLSAREYAGRENRSFIDQLKNLHGDFFLVPQGGHNRLGAWGVRNFLSPRIGQFDYICVAVGSGTTVTGICKALRLHQRAIGICVTNAREGGRDVQSLSDCHASLQLFWDFHWGGYGRAPAALVDFCNWMFRQYHLPLEPVYTGKMFYGVRSLYSKGLFPPGSRLLLLHTGGLQGARGLELYRGIKLEWMQHDEVKTQMAIPARGSGVHSGHIFGSPCPGDVIHRATPPQPGH